MPERCAIYTLADPRDHQVRYIGRTIDPAKRRREHLVDARLDFATARSAWVRGLLAIGLRPEMSIIEWCEADGAAARENAWMRWYSWQGLDLVNGQIPGGSTSDTVKAHRRARRADYPTWRAGQYALLQRADTQAGIAPAGTDTAPQVEAEGGMDESEVAHAG